VLSVSAYVPCFNNRDTIRAAVESVLDQSVRPDVTVIDDGSTDGSMRELAGLDVTIVTHAENKGRGAVRARAMREARGELVLCCDATNTVERAFVEKGLDWFDDPRVAAVFGKITQPAGGSVIDRWRGRHLFKLDAPRAVLHAAPLSTFGTIVRASAVAHCGGFNPRLRHSEDGDLGERLLATGFDVVYDPNMHVRCNVSNTLAEVLERYWRWYAGKDEGVSWTGYWKNVGYSVKWMALHDVRSGDPASVFVSLLAPHYQFWRSWARRRRPGGSAPSAPDAGQP
jgi:GT2 family glycosyltransferase